MEQDEEDKIIFNYYLTTGNEKLLDVRFHKYVENGQILSETGSNERHSINIDFIHKNRIHFKKPFLWKAYVKYLSFCIDKKDVNKCNFIFDLDFIDSSEIFNTDWGHIFNEIMQVKDFDFLCNWCNSQKIETWKKNAFELYKILLKKIFYLSIEYKKNDYIIESFDFENFGFDESHFLFFNKFSHIEVNSLATKIINLNILDFNQIANQNKLSLFEIHYLLKYINMKMIPIKLNFQQLYHILYCVILFNIPEIFINICFINEVSNIINDMNIKEENENIWETFFTVIDWYIFASMYIKYFKKINKGIPSKKINDILIISSLLLKYGKKDIPSHVVSKNLSENETFLIYEKIEVLYKCYDMIFNEMYFGDTSTVEIICKYWKEMNEISVCPGDFSYFISPIRQLFYIYYRGLIYCRKKNLKEFQYYFMKLYECKNDFVSFNYNHICCINVDISGEESIDSLDSMKIYHCKTKPDLFPNSFTQVCHNVLPYIKENDLLHEYICVQFYFNSNLNKIARTIENSKKHYFEIHTQQECIICSEMISYKLNCSHYICKKCFIECLKNNISTCGYCRQKLFPY